MHEFLLKKGMWIGEGRITFSVSPDLIKFYTRWSIQPRDDETSLIWLQEVEMHGTDEKVENLFYITPLTDTTFSVSLENQLIGQAIGRGVSEEKKLAWEIKNPQSFQGFEVYELQENGDYMMHAEYVSQDNFRTIIDGRIWKKS